MGSCNHKIWICLQDTKEKLLDLKIKFEEAKKLSVDLPDEECYADVFIDDIISICLDLSNNCTKICAGPCTVIEALERKGKTSYSVQKDELLADDKNEAEGGPVE